MIRAVTVPLLAALLLGGCGNDGHKDGPGRKAEGEILGQSVSDAMLPLDRVRSQAPLAPQSAGSGEAKKADQPETEAAEEPTEAAPGPAPAPAESPAG
jgi:hypothetical protein